VKKKKELSYKVSDFWLYQKTFERVLHDANFKDISVNEWLAHAVENKLNKDKEVIQKSIKLDDYYAKRDIVLKKINRIINEISSELFKRERSKEKSDSIDMEKARKLFHGSNCEVCGQPNPKFFHVLKPKDKSVIKKEAWRSLCSSTCLKNIGYTKNFDYIDPNVRLKNKKQELHDLSYKVTQGIINYKDVNIENIVKEIENTSNISRFNFSGMGESFS